MSLNDIVKAEEEYEEETKKEILQRIPSYEADINNISLYPSKKQFIVYPICDNYFYTLMINIFAENSEGENGQFIVYLKVNDKTTEVKAVVYCTNNSNILFAKTKEEITDKFFQQVFTVVQKYFAKL